MSASERRDNFLGALLITHAFLFLLLLCFLLVSRFPAVKLFLITLLLAGGRRIDMPDQTGKDKIWMYEGRMNGRCRRYFTFFYLFFFLILYFTYSTFAVRVYF